MSSALSPQQRFFDERFNKKLNQLHLFLQLSKRGLFCSHFEETSKEYLSFERYNFEGDGSWFSAQRSLEKILPTEQFQTAKKIIVNVVTPLYTLVPKALFDEQELANYMKFNHPIEEENQYRFYHNLVESFDAVIVYAIPRGLEFLTKAKLPPFNFNHFTLPLLEAIGLQQNKTEQLCIHIQQEQFEVIYSPNNKLEFFNSFEYKSTEDFIYYLLYVMEQLSLDRESTTVKLYGQFEEKSSIYEMLYKYIRTVEIGKRPTDVKFSPVLSEIPSHYYFNLFNQHLCG